jgi:hypothetical protein
LTLNTLIDQSSSPTASPVLDDRNTDVTNFILTLERVLSFRMRGKETRKGFFYENIFLLIANWLSERRYFWDFVRPACIGSSRQSSKCEVNKIRLYIYLLYLVIERVEEVSKTKSIKDKVNIMFTALLSLF